jgi:hypothetical protein
LLQPGNLELEVIVWLPLTYSFAPRYEANELERAQLREAAQRHKAEQEAIATQHQEELDAMTAAHTQRVTAMERQLQEAQGQLQLTRQQLEEAQVCVRDGK